MTRSDFLVVTGKEKTVITFKQTVHLELLNADQSSHIMKSIKRLQQADEIIKSVIKCEPQEPYLYFASLVYAVEYQN